MRRWGEEGLCSFQVTVGREIAVWGASEGDSGHLGVTWENLGEPGEHLGVTPCFLELVLLSIQLSGCAGNITATACFLSNFCEAT